MANPGMSKRQKERNRQEKQQDKEAARQQRRLEKTQRPAVADGEDPDLAGMVAGPQPVVEEDDDE